MHILWTEQALSDLEEIARYIEQSSSDAAQRIAKEIVDSAESLSVFPHRGRLGAAPGTRDLVLPAVGYIITYEVVGDGVFLLGIRHGSQDIPRR